jgi:hypothetical protein
MAASQAASGGCRRMRRCGLNEEAGSGRRLVGLPLSRSRFSGGMAMLLAWVLLAAPPCQGALMQDSRVPGSFRGGSISWMPVSPGSDTVRVTVNTAWLRSAGTFVRMVDGVARPEEGYQPRKGDVVKVLGPETPRFITFGMEKYLEVTVTSATEQVAVYSPPPPSSFPSPPLLPPSSEDMNIVSATFLIFEMCRWREIVQTSGQASHIPMPTGRSGPTIGLKACRCTK